MTTLPQVPTFKTTLPGPNAQALIARDMACHERVIGLRHLAGLEGHAEASMRTGIGGKHHHAAGVAIETVHDACAGKPRCDSCHEAVGLLWTDARNAQQTARFLHHHEADAQGKQAPASAGWFGVGLHRRSG